MTRFILVFRLSRSSSARTDITTVATLIQSAISTDIPVRLNQWFNQTFVIRPGEMSKSFLDLVQIYLAPRMKAMARGVDRAILGQAAVAFGTTPDDSRRQAARSDFRECV